MTRLTIADQIAAAGAGEWVKVERAHGRPARLPAPLHIFGTGTWAAKLQGSNATDAEAAVGDYSGADINGAEYTEPIVDGLYVLPRYVRLVVTSYTSGTVSAVLGI